MMHRVPHVDANTCNGKGTGQTSINLNFLLYSHLVKHWRQKFAFSTPILMSANSRLIFFFSQYTTVGLVLLE